MYVTIKVNITVLVSRLLYTVARKTNEVVQTEHKDAKDALLDAF